MLVSDFNFDLPDNLIAQQPPAVRGSSRMLCMDRALGSVADHSFAELPQMLQPGDLLVLNDSRVLPARLFATRGGRTTQHNSPSPSGVVEVLLVAPLENVEGHNDWRALVKPAKKVQRGETLFFHDAVQNVLLSAMVIDDGEFGERLLRFAPVADFHPALERIGHLPLPPYIHRDKAQPNTAEDRERYQTVYAHQPGSAAAPTAGLHFTPEILAQLSAHGVEIAHITLHVGLGTFQPVRVAETQEIRLHAERYTLSAETALALNKAHAEGRRIVAVGTTVTRTLEHLAREFMAAHGPIRAENPLALEGHSGSTSLFLSPGGNDVFHLVRGLLTNFHLPQSTLLMLVCAFAGQGPVLRAYEHAVRDKYRFFSYGDCMLIL